jgi:hypothetical protein
LPNYVLTLRLPYLDIRGKDRVRWGSSEARDFPAKDDDAARRVVDGLVEMFTIRDCGQSYPPRVVSLMERNDRIVDLAPPNPPP